jgi:hypothetical protein
MMDSCDNLTDERHGSVMQVLSRAFDVSCGVAATPHIDMMVKV